MPKTLEFSQRHIQKCVLALPAAYRLQEVLAFHQRDGQQLAEHVVLQSNGLPILRKALDWQGQPAWMELRWECCGAKSAMQVRASLHTAFPAVEDTHRWPATVRRMLGLAYPPDALEAAHGGHAQLGALLARQRGLHVPAAPTAWEALTWAITGQQISVAAAVTLRRRLIQAVDMRIVTAADRSLLAYPNAVQVLGLGVEGLRGAGYSHSKAQAMLTAASMVEAGTLPLERWMQNSDAGHLDAVQVDAIAQQLLSVPGIGPWTVHYTLLRGLGWPDGSLHGDVAVRKALARLQGVDKVTERQTRDWLAQFAPWRALVAAHLWASLSSTAY